ncbi:MAG: type II toxin-antitoxin system RelB/DinJ family antitoxin, partial [Clostridia bacterium]|nr:type II toxin-antitoxin system RelB/DinJ family antitoxin [Clostridia bacterium]
MATKTANVTARVHPDIKQQAEEVLEQLGIPVSVLIDSLYRQIIMTKSIPYSFAVTTLQTRDTITDAQLNTMMAKGLSEAKADQGVSVDDAFVEINNPDLYFNSGDDIEYLIYDFDIATETQYPKKFYFEFAATGSTGSGVFSSSASVLKDSSSNPYISFG